MTKDERENLRRQTVFEQIFDDLPEAVVLCDAGHRIIEINREFTALFGYTAEEAIGRKIQALLVPAEEREAYAYIPETLREGLTMQIECERMCKDGSRKEVSLLVRPRVVDGRVAYIYSIYRDIREKKRQERLQAALYRIAELASTDGDLESLYRSIHGVLAGLIASRNCCIALYDEAAQKLSFPYLEDECDDDRSARPFGNGLTEYVIRTGEALWADAAKMDSLEREGKARCMGRRPVEWLGVPLIAEGRPIGVLSVRSHDAALHFTAEDREMLLFVSRQIARAIQHQQDLAALRAALAEVKQLSGLLPICCSCKMIRDDKGYWNQIESYIRERSEAEFSHGICPDCAQKLYPEYCQTKS